ncbi:MAG: hypothetical protein VW362_03260 [Candidatus Nanopelagicales bacterium]|jgi:hypothetical protein
MDAEAQGPAEVLRSIWQADDSGVPELDAECSPTKACRNMKDVSFDGFAEEGGDIATAWRNTLAREGKLGSGTVADLVFGNGD